LVAVGAVIAMNDGDRDRAAQDDLRSTRDAIRFDARQVEALEAEKGKLHPGDPRVTEISQRVVEITDRLLKATLVEKDLTEELRAAHEHRAQRRSEHRAN
jgi:hypothetical protein